MTCQDVHMRRLETRTCTNLVFPDLNFTDKFELISVPELLHYTGDYINTINEYKVPMLDNHVASEVSKPSKA